MRFANPLQILILSLVSAISLFSYGSEIIQPIKLPKAHFRILGGLPNLIPKSQFNISCSGSTLSYKNSIFFASARHCFNKPQAVYQIDSAELLDSRILVSEFHFNSKFGYGDKVFADEVTLFGINNDGYTVTSTVPISRVLPANHKPVPVSEKSPKIRDPLWIVGYPRANFDIYKCRYLGKTLSIRSLPTSPTVSIDLVNKVFCLNGPAPTIRQEIGGIHYLTSYVSGASGSVVLNSNSEAVGILSSEDSDLQGIYYYTSILPELPPSSKSTISGTLSPISNKFISVEVETTESHRIISLSLNAPNNSTPARIDIKKVIMKPLVKPNGELPYPPVKFEVLELFTEKNKGDYKIIENTLFGK